MSTAEQVAAVERMVRDQVAAVVKLEPAALAPTLEVLRRARDELRNDLRVWLATVENPAERFTAQRLRVALRAVESAIATAEDLAVAMATGLERGRVATAHVAVAGVDEEIAKFSGLFGESLIAPPIDVAAVLAEGKRLLVPQFRTSAIRYAGNVGADIRAQLAVGVAKNETFTQLTNRMQKLGGPRGFVALRGASWDPDAIVEHISEGLFRRYRWWGERIVRTEMMNSYNVQHAAGIEALNADLDDDEEPFVSRWDATHDRRLCPFCRSLDGRLARPGEAFADGIRHAPAHPCCRCVEVAWHRTWGNLRGEVPPTYGAVRPAPRSRTADPIVYTSP